MVFVRSVLVSSHGWHERTEVVEIITSGACSDLVHSEALLVLGSSIDCTIHHLLIAQALIVKQSSLRLEFLVLLSELIHLIIRVVSMFKSVLVAVEVEIEFELKH